MAGSTDHPGLPPALARIGATLFGNRTCRTNSTVLVVARKLVIALLLWSGNLVVTPCAQALDPRQALTQYAHQQWGPENGLPCYSVVSLVQSGDGYLWLGTEEGLARFDGIRTKVFDQTNEPELGNSSILVVALDSSRPGSLLVGTQTGVLSFVGDDLRSLPAAVTATTTAMPLGRSVWAVERDEVDGTLWVGTSQGLFCIRSDGQVLSPDDAVGRPQAPVAALCRDGVGQLCVGTAQGLYRQPKLRRGESGGFERVPGLDERPVTCLSPAADGSLWVGTREGAGRLRENTFLPRPELAGRHVMCLLEDRAGMLWAGTNGGGLYRLAAADGGELGASVLTAARGLVGDVVRDLCEDREGNLWVASTAGLQVLRDVRFTTLGKPEGLIDDCVWSFWEDSAGRLWIGSENGLNSVDSSAAASGKTTTPSGSATDGGLVVNYPVPELASRPGDKIIYCVGSDEGFEPSDSDGRTGGVLAGTHAGGLLHLHNGSLERLHIRDDLDREDISAFCSDATGAFWVACHVGLYQLRHGTVVAHYTTASGELPNDLVSVIHADRRGNLWIATDGGLVRRDAVGRFTNFAQSGSPLAVSINCFYEDPSSGDLFVGSVDGLFRLRSQEDGGMDIKRYTTHEGLFDNKAWSVLGDGEGNLWMSSNKGISRLSLSDLERFDRHEIASIPTVSYGVADGMRSKECNGGCQMPAWRDRSGRLWFATEKGAACMEPAHALKRNLLSPPVHVEELLADGHLVLPTIAHSLELPAGTQRLDFRYTALSFTAPETNRFRCRLEGYEQSWREVGIERAAHYTNLAPGVYNFRVQAANADGVWNEQGASLSLRLKPFFYQSGWFRVLSAACVLGFGWFWLRRYKRRLLARLAQAEAEVAERKRTQETLRQAKEAAECARMEAEAAQTEAERASQAKSEFLSRVSHELRTPLNAILGFGQLLELDKLTSRQQQSVGQILGGGRHLLGLVDEVLDLARIEHGEVALRFEDVDLHSLLAEVVGLMVPLARERDVRLHLEENRKDAVTLRTDRQRLRQVLLNLVANAVKYNRPTGGEVLITASISLPSAPEPPVSSVHLTEQGRLRLSIRDTGMGIAAKDLAKLFTPFERLGAAHGPIKGTGLGLTVSKQLVEAMGGTIGVESTPEVGSTFWLELPGLVVPLNEDRQVESFLPLASELDKDLLLKTGSAEKTAAANLASPILLYVEDNPANRDLVTHVIADFRPELRLLLAHDAEQGLAIAYGVSRPDLILLDLNLPGMSGEAALAQLRANPRTAAVPVIILSGDATTSSREKLLAAGACAYLTKPFRVQNFLVLLEELLPFQSSPEEFTFVMKA